MIPGYDESWTRKGNNSSRSQKKNTKPAATLASAHHGVASGEPIYAICAQSNVINDIPYNRPINICGVCSERGTYQATAVPEQLVDDNVVRDDPAHPVEERERLEDVAGEEVPTCRREETVEEEPLATDTTAVTDTGVDLRVQRVEECTGDQVRRPDWSVPSERTSQTM